METAERVAGVLDDSGVEALALHLWDEGIIRPEHVALEAVRAVRAWLLHTLEEPDPPEECYGCEMPYDECTKRILRGRVACCEECQTTETHKQGPWEDWKRSRQV